MFEAAKKHGNGNVDCMRAARADIGESIMSVVAMVGGFNRFCDCGSNERGTLVAQFRSAWEANVKRTEQVRRLPAAVVPRLNAPEHAQESLELRIDQSATQAT